MNNSPAGWWKEGRESAKRWGGVTLVPAGCRSPGRCCGNHSHQPDGISVGEHEKDGSGSVLPGPARPKNNSGPIRYLEREHWACRTTLQSQVMRMRGQTRWKCSFSAVVVSCYPISWNLLIILNLSHINCPFKHSEKTDLRGHHQSRRKRLLFDFTCENLGSLPLLAVTLIPLLFLAMSQCCAHTAK